MFARLPSKFQPIPPARFASKSPKNELVHSIEHALANLRIGGSIFAGIADKSWVLYPNKKAQEHIQHFVVPGVDYLLLVNRANADDLIIQKLGQSPTKSFYHSLTANSGKQREEDYFLSQSHFHVKAGRILDLSDQVSIQIPDFKA